MIADRAGATASTPGQRAAATARILTAAYGEDLGAAGDVTSQAVVPPDQTATARIVAREPGVVAGLKAAAAALTHRDRGLQVEVGASPGDAVVAGQLLIEATGRLWSVLAAERVALNLLGHLSGIATRTRAFVDEVAGTGCQVRDTRKTTPGLRVLEKAAVVAGGGANHRLGLYDALLVKDNHAAAVGGLAAAARHALERAHGRPVQVEIDRPDQLEAVLAVGVDDVLLDNFTPAELAVAVEAAAGRARLEASGGITLATVREVAETGVDRVAVGELTHSAPWLDVALEVEG